MTELTRFEGQGALIELKVELTPAKATADGWTRYTMEAPVTMRYTNTGKSTVPAFAFYMTSEDAPLAAEHERQVRPSSKLHFAKGAARLFGGAKGVDVNDPERLTGTGGAVGSLLASSIPTGGGVECTWQVKRSFFSDEDGDDKLVLTQVENRAGINDRTILTNFLAAGLTPRYTLNFSKGTAAAG
ncbi:hypothetical protein [Streptomyces sp. NPDC091027]|uniref:hypothetical protein n=1 Tax=Streptomyces sp. NPDC091027 TaxID=3365971 RepID=UPI003816A7D7